MVSDEELARRVEQAEIGESVPSRSDESLSEYKQRASEIHDELASRIRAVDDRAVGESELSVVVERLDELERRLDELDEQR